MASIRRLTGGGFSIKVSDTELALLRSAVAQTKRTNGNEVQILTDSTEDQTMITEALDIRDHALAELSKSMAGFEADGEEFE